MSWVAAWGLVLLTPIAAQAARVSLTGQVTLSTTPIPVENARITVTFHGHELGIHEYTTVRRVRVSTDATGQFTAVVKVPDDRYHWTHATVEIAETDMSKTAQGRAICQVDRNGGGRCDKTFAVSPLRP